MDPQQRPCTLGNAYSCKPLNVFLCLLLLIPVFSTNIMIGALIGKTTHFILTWDPFEDKQLVKLFNHFSLHHYFPKTGQDSQTVTLAFKFDVSDL